MPIVNRLKKFILGEEKSKGSVNKVIPSIVRLETEVSNYWNLEEVIGEGAFGNVYKATSKSDPSRVAAAKAMELEDDEGTDVMVEVAILTQCKHPNIVQLFDAFTMGNRITLLLEYCGGGAVDGIMIELSRGLTEAQIQYIMKEILKALNFLHSRNVIHRDLKAGNVLLTNDAEVKLADFGVSALNKDAREVRSTFIGTPYWMAPEVMVCETFPEKHYNHLADIWSFGITLIEMADQRPPYADMNPAKVIFKVIKADPPTFERPSLWSVSFRNVVSRCLVKDPDNRPTAADLLAHAFFAKEGDIGCVKQLVSEMHAEQVTTEVVDSELEDEDDASSSIDLRNGIGDSESALNEAMSDTKSVVSEKEPSKGDLGAADKIGELSPTLDAPTLPALKNDNEKFIGGVRAISQVDELTKHEKNVAVVMVGENEEGSRARSRDGHAAAMDALEDLDHALSLEEACDHDLPEEPSPLAPTLELAVEPLPLSILTDKTPQLQIASNDAKQVTPKDTCGPDVDNKKAVSSKPLPTHSIRDAIEHARCPTTVCISDEGTVVSDSATVSFGEPKAHAIGESAVKLPCEISKSAHFQRALQEESASRVLKEVKKPVHEITSLKVQIAHAEDAKAVETAVTDIAVSSPVAELVRKFQQPHIVSKSKGSGERKSVDSLLQNCSAMANGASVTSRSSSQPVVNISEDAKKASKDVHPTSRAEKRPLCSSLSIDSSAEKKKTSKSEEPDGLEPRPMRAEFKVLPANCERTLVEVRRPVSYPNSFSQRNSSVGKKSPPVSAHTEKGLQNILKEGEVVSSSQKTASASHDSVHQLSPTTSQATSYTSAEHAYFSTTSSSSSNKLSSQSAYNIGFEEKEAEFMQAPPPEPPVDYEDEKKAIEKAASGTPKPTLLAAHNKRKPDQVGQRKSPHRQTVTKKTRVYVVDGVQMTSTSHQVFGVKQDYELRKQQLHDLRRLQREEARQQRELNAKAESLRNEQAKRFASDKEAVIKAADAELQSLARTQKRQLKEREDLHNEELKQAVKRIQAEQERELRAFREVLKQEQKQLKMETESLPKAQRKDVYRVKKEQLDREQQKREVDFADQQQKNQAALINKVQLDHKMEIVQIEKKFQQQRHAILRSREASEWDLEEKQLAERHILIKQELKDRFYLQRTQMLARHQRELEHMRKVHEMNEEEAIRSYATFKKKLPKDFRTESKTRILMFKESLRISCQGDDPATLNEKMRAFEEKEKMRVRNALEEHDTKSARRMKEMREKNAAAIKELEEIHNEKRKMLLEAEQNKTEVYEKEYEQVVADWKAGLPMRKQLLEAEFARDLDEVDAFYRKENAQLQSIVSKPVTT